MIKAIGVGPFEPVRADQMEAPPILLYPFCIARVCIAKAILLMPVTESYLDAANRRRLAWRFLPILCAAVLPYLPSLTYGFVYDDDIQVLRMPTAHPWHFIPAYFFRPIPGFAAPYYRPLFFLWLKLNHSLWDTHPFGWHLDCVILHAIASLLVFAVLGRYFQDQRSSTVGALVFALHPVHVETVAWVSGCTDAMMTIGLLAGLWLQIRNWEAPSLSRRVGSLVCCALALLCKETAVILPAVIFFHVLAGIPDGGSLSKEKKGKLTLAMMETAPYLVVTALYLGVRYWVLRQASSAIPEWISRREAFLTMPSVLLFYLKHIVWPFKLSLNYDLPIASQASSFLFWIPLIFLAAGASAIWAWLRSSRKKAIIVAVFWLLLPLAPVLYIRLFAQDDFVHDRYLYLPVLGLAVFTGLLSESLWKQWAWEKGRGWLLAVAGAAVTLLGLVTVAQERPWKNNLLLYKNSVTVSPNNMLGRNNLAREYFNQGRYVEASEMFKAILEQRPGMWLANYNYGYVNYVLGNLAVAEEYLRRAIRIDPDDPDQYICLGGTYLKEGHAADAAQQVGKAIARRPDGPGYHFALAIIEWQRGNLAFAREQMLEELKYHPENRVARVQMQAIEKQLATEAH